MTDPRIHRDEHGARIVLADSLEYLKTLPDNSVDSVVTDPPYEIGFMGRGWDSTGIAYSVELWKECLRVLKPGGHALVFGATRTYHRVAVAIEDAGFEIRDSIHWMYGSGFPKSMAIDKAIDKQRDDRSDSGKVAAYLLTYNKFSTVSQFREYLNENILGKKHSGGSAQEWTTTNLEAKTLKRCPSWEQWLELKNLLQFDDSMDAEVWRLNGRKGQPGEAWEQREVIGSKKSRLGGTVAGGDRDPEVIAKHKNLEFNITAPATPEAQQWAGWGTALKPAHEPIVVARKPVEGTVAQNVLTYGVGGLNIDASRVGTTKDVPGTPNSKGENSGYNKGWADRRPEDSGMNPNIGRFPANILLTHSAECEQVGEASETMVGGFGNGGIGVGETGQSGDSGKGAEWVGKKTTTPVYQCVQGCPVAALDEQSGEGASKQAFRGEQYSGSHGGLAGEIKETKEGTNTLRGHSDSGGASRFFTNTEHDLIDDADPFYYSAKAPKKERPVHPETGKGHPTVKPLEVMRWLIKLVTPAGGTVLEPFAGSGATVEAALLDGYKIIAIDITPDHMPLIDVRVDRVVDGSSPGLNVKPKKKAQSAPQKPSTGPLTALDAAQVAMEALARKKAPTALTLFEENDNA